MYRYKNVAYLWVESGWLKDETRYMTTYNGADDSGEIMAQELSRQGKYAVIVNYSRHVGQAGAVMTIGAWELGHCFMVSLGNGQHLITAMSEELASTWEHWLAPARMRENHPNLVAGAAV